MSTDRLLLGAEAVNNLAARTCTRRARVAFVRGTRIFHSCPIWLHGRDRGSVHDRFDVDWARLYHSYYVYTLPARVAVCCIFTGTSVYGLLAAR